jgi:hypothetical protein
MARIAAIATQVLEDDEITMARRRTLEPESERRPREATRVA